MTEPPQSLVSHNKTLGFIGSGNMAQAIIAGLITQAYPPHKISVSSPDAQQCQDLQQRFAVSTMNDNRALAEACELVFLCVKPQQAEAVCTELAASWQPERQTLVSIAAGLSTEQLCTWLNPDAAVVRCMPNTPVRIRKGCSILFARPGVSPAHRKLCQAIFSAVGFCDWIEDEEKMHAVTALSGSGPAYVFQFLEALQSAGEAMGLSRELSAQLAVSTVVGAGSLAEHTQTPAHRLKQQVMSPGGTTEQGIAWMQAKGFNACVEGAVLQARKRSYTLAGLTPPVEPDRHSDSD